MRRKHLNAAANAKVLIDAVLLQRFELLDALVQAFPDRMKGDVDDRD